jgi:tetratricopeptide (TPR) repeat protein
VSRAINQIERGGHALQLEPLAMDVLVHLATKPGEVVSIDELIARIWNGRATDGSVYRTINQLRRALEGDSEEATKRYLRILELDPRNALAQTGLIGLLGRADPLAAESRLKSLIARDPAPYLYFTLGNLYADQSLWPSAQQAYFQAYHLEPTNPDYAYNLAVSLEHVGQPKAALGYYRRAAKLAGSGATTHFNLAQAQERIGKLASQVE